MDYFFYSLSFIYLYTENICILINYSRFRNYRVVFFYQTIPSRRSILFHNNTKAETLKKYLELKKIAPDVAKFADSRLIIRPSRVKNRILKRVYWCRCFFKFCFKPTKVFKNKQKDKFLRAPKKLSCIKKRKKM